MAVSVPVPNGQVSTSELATWLALAESGWRENCFWRIDFPPPCGGRAHVAAPVGGGQGTEEAMPEVGTLVAAPAAKAG